MQTNKKKPEIQIFHFLYLKVPSNDQTIDLNSDDLTTNDFNSFTTNAFLDLETKVYGDNWSIPYKRSSKRNISIIFNLFRLGEEALGHCLLSATKLALAGKIQTRIFLFDLFLLTQAQPIKINIVLNLWKN